MIKEALAYVAELANTKITQVDGRPFSNGRLSLIEMPLVAPIVVRTLKGLVDYLTSEFDGSSQLMVHIMNPTRVEVYSHLNQDKNRNVFLRADAFVPEFRFGRWYDTEEFNIALQSVFLQDNDRDIILKIVGNLRDEAVRNTGDDGVSQSVTTRSGIATVAEVKVPNPVILRPFRTFVEVKQPESSFVFRMRSGEKAPQCALFEADGGNWQVEAVDIIRAYLENALEKKIAGGDIVLIS